MGKGIGYIQATHLRNITNEDLLQKTPQMPKESLLLANILTCKANAVQN